MCLRKTSSTGLRVSSASPGAAPLLLMLTSLVCLDGCQVVKGIFEAGFGVGVVVVVAVVAIVGGVVALVTRK